MALAQFTNKSRLVQKTQSGKNRGFVLLKDRVNMSGTHGFVLLSFSLPAHSIPHMYRLSLTLTPRRMVSWASDAETSSRSWTTLTLTGGREDATGWQACSPVTTWHQSTGTCKQTHTYQQPPHINPSRRHQEQRGRMQQGMKNGGGVLLTASPCRWQLSKANF